MEINILGGAGAIERNTVRNVFALSTDMVFSPS